MSLADIATINVTTTGAGVTRAGYGVPAITSFTAAWAERYRSYSSLDAVSDDFAANTPEYLAAEVIFSQSPSVERVVVIRCANQPTQRWAISSSLVATGANYSVRIAVATGTVFTSQDATFSSAGATAWAPSGLYSKGDIVANDTSVGYQYIYSCLGPSSIAYENGFTGYGGASGPIGVTGSYRENGVFWAFVGTGGTGVLTNDAVMYGLKARIEALGAPTAVASGGAGNNQMVVSIQGGALSRTLRLLANSPAKFFGVQVYDRSMLNLAQDHADPGIATDLAAVKNAYNSWYGLITTFNSEALCNAAAAWVESNTKLYAAGTQDSAVATVTESSTATDVGHDFKAAAYARSWVFYHPSNDDFADAAEMGKFLAYEPGSETWRMKTLNGVTVATYTDTEKTNLEARYAHYYEEIGGVNVVNGDGKTAEGDYVDVTRGLDWYTSELQAKLANLAIANPKIPFTNLGIDMIAAKIRQQNQAGIDAGLIAPYPEPVISVPDVADVSSEDKADRELADVETEWTLAGAIHHITVNVTANV